MEQEKDMENKENQEDDPQHREMLMEEAIKILNQEGFSLPGDVVDTLHTVGRSNAAARRRGALRAHKMSEFESRAKKFRNKRESSAKRNQGRATPEARETTPQSDENQQTSNVNNSAMATSMCEENASNTEMARSSQNSSSVSATAASVSTSAEATSASSTSVSGDVKMAATDTGTESDIVTETSVVSTTTSKIEEQDSDDVFLQESIEKNARAKLEREESAEESSSTCSASTVREMKEVGKKNLMERQDSTSSVESSASSMNKMKGLGRLESVGSDTGYNTSIENVVQTREAKAENLKNMNKATSEQQGQKFNNGLRRDLSRDSGFTETGFQSCQSPVSPIPPISNQAKSLATQDFNDMTISNSDVSERFISSDNGEAHVVTSAASDLTAAEMTTNGDAMTEDGTAVSSRAKLENQESNSTLLRVTNKATDEEVSKEDDYESVSQTSKSSRNDSISTSASGQQTAASRHAASMEQGLYKERSKLATSQDGSRVAADMSVDQQLTRNQEMNNSEQVDDGTCKNETKKTTEKSLTSKSLREEKLLNQDGSVAGSITSSQNMDSNLRCSEIDETLTKADGSVVKRKDDNSTSSMKESSSTEKRSVKQLPYGGGKSTEIVKKSDNSSVSNTSKVQCERNETATGVSEKKHEEDSKSMSSSFSGVCESEEVVNGSTLKRVQSSEQSSESKVKSSRSVSSYNSRASVADVPEHQSRERKLSDASDVSNFSNLSKENINPPSYEETMSNLSRRGSIGSVSSGYSRQDSSASSIASSAGAFNERQRQKKLEKEKDGLIRENSYENEPDYRGRDFGRQESYSSDSTISAGNEYEGREIVHPIRKVDSHHTYGRSLTDSAIGQKVNRRATLDGDIVITDKELRRAREEVRSNLRGRDDSFIDRGGRFDSESPTRRDKFGDFGSFGSGSFKKDVMNLVDSFFDDDDGFGIGFGRNRRKKRDSGSHDDPLSTRRREDNPYTMRDDLSKYRREQEKVRGEAVDIEYAASDSGYPKPSRRSRVEELETDFTDVASDSGHNRFGSSSSRREADNFNYSKNFGQSNCRSTSRGKQDNNYQYSHLSNRVSAISADDILLSAGKSIHDDRNINTSESCENITRPRINNNSFDNRTNSHYQTARDGDYNTYFRDSNLDMNEASSASSLHSMSRDAHAHSSKRVSDTDDYSSRSSRKEVGRSRSNKQKHSEESLVHEESEKWNDRRHRIDKALSWIRGELMYIDVEPLQGVLRTQDKVLMSQFQRCQDSIEELKKQKPWYEVFSDDEYDDDNYEDGGRHWEDWEIDEFDRRDRETNLRSSALTSDSRRNFTSSKTSQRPSAAVYTKDSQRFSMTTIE